MQLNNWCARHQIYLVCNTIWLAEIIFAKLSSDNELSWFTFIFTINLSRPFRWSLTWPAMTINDHKKSFKNNHSFGYSEQLKNWQYQSVICKVSRHVNTNAMAQVPVHELVRFICFSMTKIPSTGGIMKI